MKVKKILAVLLAVTVMLAFTACGSSSEGSSSAASAGSSAASASAAESAASAASAASAGATDQSVAGDWTTQIDIGKLVAKSLGATMENAGLEEGKYMVDVDLSFTEDGKYSLTMDTEKVKATIRELAGPLIKTIIGDMPNTPAMLDTTAMVDNLVQEFSAGFEEGSFNAEGTYELDGDKLIMDGEWQNTSLVFKGDSIDVEGAGLENYSFVRK